MAISLPTLPATCPPRPSRTTQGAPWARAPGDRGSSDQRVILIDDKYLTAVGEGSYLDQKR